MLLELSMVTNSRWVVFRMLSKSSTLKKEAVGLPKRWDIDITFSKHCSTQYTAMSCFNYRFTRNLQEINSLLTPANLKWHSLYQADKNAYSRAISTWT